jgi:DNA-binding response OmpR family regulator
MIDPQPLLLIVEDDLSTRYILSKILVGQGWNVFAVPTLAEGLNLLDLKPVCVIVDLLLSDGHGEALLRHIREEGIESHVVVCTAVRNEERLEAVRTLHPAAIIHKPIEWKELLQACTR